jgi:hypothetical protein
MSQVASCWPYSHDRFEDDIFTENAQDWNEVVARRDDPKGTKFKAMSWEEQVTTLEQKTQEFLRIQEGAVASESGEEIYNPQEDIEALRVFQESPV